MDDKRGCRRKRVLREARIVLNSGQSVINCIVRDQSEIGAKLRVAAATVLPTTFELLCLTEQVLRPAEIAWRRGYDLGIRFVGPPRGAPPRKW